MALAQDWPKPDWTNCLVAQRKQTVCEWIGLRIDLIWVALTVWIVYWNFALSLSVFRSTNESANFRNCLFANMQSFQSEQLSALSIHAPLCHPTATRTRALSTLARLLMDLRTNKLRRVSSHLPITSIPSLRVERIKKHCQQAKPELA